MAVGQPAPPIAGATIDGGQADLASLRGRPVLVNFWGPTCVPCREETPLLAQKLQEHAADGFTYWVSSRTTASRRPGVRGAVRRDVADGQLPDKSIRSAYRVFAYPQSYFVDANGMVTSIQPGYLTDADFERQYAKIEPAR